MSRRIKKIYWCKVFQTKYDIVVAICDKELLGKKIESTKFEITVKEGFYGGKLISEGVAIRLMNKATIGNIIGPHIVAAAEKNGFITPENVILIDEIPHAQFVKL